MPRCPGCEQAAARDRAGLERLLSDCARPPFALERLDRIDDQRVVYRLPHPKPDGTEVLSLTPLELIDRLAAQLVHKLATAETTPASVPRRSCTQLALACCCRSLWA